MKPLQDLYPDDFSHCYGCGRLNADGLHVKSEWHDGEAVARFQPAELTYGFADQVGASHSRMPVEAKLSDHGPHVIRRRREFD